MEKERRQTAERLHALMGQWRQVKEIKKAEKEQKEKRMKQSRNQGKGYRKNLHAF